MDVAGQQHLVAITIYTCQCIRTDVLLCYRHIGPLSAGELRWIETPLFLIGKSRASKITLTNKTLPQRLKLAFP